MKLVNEIRCPHCSKTFILADQLRDEIIGGLRLDMEKEIEKENEAFRKEEQKRLEQKYWDKYAKEKEKLHNDQAKQKEILQQTQQLETKIRRDRLELETLKQEYSLQKEEDLQIATKEAILKTRREVSEEYSLKEKEWSKKFSDQGKLIEELKRKSEQVPIQLQGHVQEQAIEETLQEAFPGDRITRTVAGSRGADILHKIYSRNGKSCGSILFESKR
ncbi:MAG: DUF2130 domain-containing protein, partial [Saprospiraceae bacterium]|nr:DUF2130 domain-containing protein [Saprospiraceae bacterium]